MASVSHKYLDSMRQHNNSPVNVLVMDPISNTVEVVYGPSGGNPVVKMVPKSPSAAIVTEPSILAAPTACSNTADMAPFFLGSNLSEDAQYIIILRVIKKATHNASYFLTSSVHWTQTQSFFLVN